MTKRVVCYLFWKTEEQKFKLYFSVLEMYCYPMPSFHLQERCELWVKKARKCVRVHAQNSEEGSEVTQGGCHLHNSSYLLQFLEALYIFFAHT